MVYYIQAWHLAFFGKKVFNKDFQAWVHGPVLPELYYDYNNFKWHPIEKDIGKEKIDEVEEKLDDEQVELLHDVIDEYFGLPAYELERLTHEEEPWKKARNGLEPDQPSREKIKKEWIKKYYKQFLEN